MSKRVAQKIPTPSRVASTPKRAYLSNHKSNTPTPVDAPAQMLFTHLRCAFDTSNYLASCPPKFNRRFKSVRLSSYACHF